jgi:hypothetical protein
MNRDNPVVTDEMVEAALKVMDDYGRYLSQTDDVAALTLRKVLAAALAASRSEDCSRSRQTSSPQEEGA